MKDFLEDLNRRTLGAYEQRRSLIAEHHGIEETVLAGGYGYRQILELVQNGADAILEAHEDGLPMPNGNRIDVVLRNSCLYVANTGAPLSQEGLDALLGSHTSPKRGNEIGRFGLGFKSLLRLKGRIDIFTKASGAIRFDPAACRELIASRFNASHAPGLRLAWPLDEVQLTSDSDAFLKEFEWAETIVRVEVNAQDFVESLQAEIKNFPKEFLLFLADHITINLDDGVSELRALNVIQHGDEHLLTVGEEQTRWRVFTKSIEVTDERAIADATHIHARDQIPVSWAIPLDVKREEAGRFWAFFPTHTASYIPGILNAPWKLNSDRNAIIGGEWNSLLMREAAKLIVGALPELGTERDPARALDFLPRQPERKDEDAAPLLESIWLALEFAPVIPDATGELRIPTELWRHPRDSVELAHQWKVIAGAKERRKFVHPLCLEGQRRSRLNFLADQVKSVAYTQPSIGALRCCGTSSWFSLIASTDVETAISVLMLAEQLHKDCRPNEWSQIRQDLKVIPSSSGELKLPNEVVFAPVGESAQIQGRDYVHPELVRDDELRRILRDTLCVREVSDEVWLDVLDEGVRRITGWDEATDEKNRRDFWQKFRAAPEGAQVAFISRRKPKIQVLCICGEWANLDEVLLAGGLVNYDDAKPNWNYLIDPDFHREDGCLLSKLGIVAIPSGKPVSASCAYSLKSEWLQQRRGAYKESHNNSASWDYLKPTGFSMPAGWKLLENLEGRAVVMLTRQFLDALSEHEFPDHVGFGHSTVDQYPKMQVTHPLKWLLLRHGMLEIGGALLPLSVLSARKDEPVLQCFEERDQIASDLELLSDVEAFSELRNEAPAAFWEPLICAHATLRGSINDSLQALWEGAARDGIVPDAFKVDGEIRSLATVYVTSSIDLAKRLRCDGRVIVTLDEVAHALWIEKGARDLSELIRPEWDEVVSPVALLVDAFPELYDVLNEASIASAGCQAVSGLRLKVEGERDYVPCVLWNGVLQFDSAHLSRLSRAKRLESLIRETSGADWLKFNVQEAIRLLGDAKVDELRATVFNCASFADKVLCAVGGRVEPLIETLGSVGEKSFIKECSPVQLAGLVLSQYGPATLSRLTSAMSEEGLKPPHRWNTEEAREFAESIGFPVEFASSPSTRRDPEEIVSGPMYLPELHDFQKEVMDGVRSLVNSPENRRRAVVSLPTGGGKTRVAVQAAIEYFLAPNDTRRRVIWIAQTDELCEQAVQAFKQVWLNKGAQGTDLRIVRLWGGNRNPSINEIDKPIVVVASIQTLNSRMGSGHLEWLNSPGLVVTDECHHAITPSYTNLLRWLDAEPKRSKEAETEEPIILGLSATPFRANDEESERLAKRFDSQWFPSDQQELHARLRRQGVLSEVEYRPLDSGVGINPEEENRLVELWNHRDGLEFERLVEEINQRLAKNSKRNQLMVDYIQQSEKHSTLFFANSVSHAEEMAARLNLMGIPAAAISGGTPRSARRYFLEKFQNGEIQVLCNHCVLTTGFDAPRTDVVVISRNVFSAVRYMQMVGRGLRGVANGGTAKCKIVTVMDNLGRFQDRHPYHYCEKYFPV